VTAYLFSSNTIPTIMLLAPSALLLMYLCVGHVQDLGLANDITCAMPIELGSTLPAPLCGRLGTLPRKEVIQPQLPLRLPCYDFVPVISPTLGSCLLLLRAGWPTDFRCCQLP
jgi:hypothetical protein